MIKCYQNTDGSYTAYCRNPVYRFVETGYGKTAEEAINTYIKNVVKITDETMRPQGHVEVQGGNPIVRSYKEDKLC